MGIVAGAASAEAAGSAAEVGIAVGDGFAVATEGLGLGRVAAAGDDAHAEAIKTSAQKQCDHTPGQPAVSVKD